MCKGVAGLSGAGEAQRPLDDLEQSTYLQENHQLHAVGFRQDAIHRRDRCIIAPLSKAKGFSFLPDQRLLTSFQELLVPQFVEMQSQEFPLPEHLTVNQAH